VPRYRFDRFILSPRRRLLIRDGHELPLIPRYFDLLVFLIEHRHEAVHRREIFDRVWSDVVVSDSALSQAIRTLRRTLGEDPREARFIRTVSRHGYRFVFSNVIQEEDDEAWPPRIAEPSPEPMVTDQTVDPFEPLLGRITHVARNEHEEEDRREAAELLHALGTAEALRRLGDRPGHTTARALLRDARWESPQAEDVPVLGSPAPIAVSRELIAFRLRRAGRVTALRWAGAVIGGGLAGVIAGAMGGLLLTAAPGSAEPIAVIPVLAAIGGACGAIGAAGVGAGLSLAEAVARSARSIALIGGAAFGGALVGSAVQWLTRWSFLALVGIHVETGGALEGLVIGATAGLGYAIGTLRTGDGLAAPRGRQRFRAATLTALLSGAGALALTLAGRPLVGGTLHEIAREAHGSQITLTPIARLIGEPDFGPVSQRLIGTGEGAVFGFGMALGLMRRPSSRTSHETLTDR
jgi:DNA-binding winged helix-turn-helix (wHTH) protein